MVFRREGGSIDIQAVLRLTVGLGDYEDVAKGVSTSFSVALADIFSSEPSFAVLASERSAAIVSMSW